MMERYEDMNRMREHVFSEVDKNKDRQISMQEFIDSTGEEDFDNDEEWDVCIIYVEREIYYITFEWTSYKEHVTIIFTAIRRGWNIHRRRLGSIRTTKAMDRSCTAWGS